MFYRTVFHHRQFRYLGAFYLHSIIRLFALSLFQLFNGIYIFQLAKGVGLNFNQSLGVVSLFFMVMFAFQAIATVPALWFIAKKGLRFAVFWGNLFLILYVLFLLVSKFDIVLLIFATIVGGFSIGFYWTAYHIYFAELSDDKKQGEELSIGNVLSAISSIGGPAFGGLIINYWGYPAALVVMSILVIVAILPLKYLPKTEDKVAVHILPIVYSLSPQREVKSLLAITGMGVTEITYELFWPIFTFPILSGFIGIGFMGSIGALMVMFTTLGVGLLVDKFGPRRIINIFSSVESITWVLQSFVISPMHVFASSAVSAATRSAQTIALDSIIYNRARHYDLVAFIFQREMGLAIGRGIFLLVIALLFWFGMPLIFVFLIVAFIALLTRLYPRQVVNSKQE